MTSEPLLGVCFFLGRWYLRCCLEWPWTIVGFKALSLALKLWCCGEIFITFLQQNDGQAYRWANAVVKTFELRTEF